MKNSINIITEVMPLTNYHNVSRCLISVIHLFWFPTSFITILFRLVLFCNCSPLLLLLQFWVIIFLIVQIQSLFLFCLDDLLLIWQLTVSAKRTLTIGCKVNNTNGTTCTTNIKIVKSFNLENQYCKIEKESRSQYHWTWRIKNIIKPYSIN